MTVWSAEIKELEVLYKSFKGQFPDLDKELDKLVKADDENIVLLYSRRCLEVIATDLFINHSRKNLSADIISNFIYYMDYDSRILCYLDRTLEAA